MIKTSVRMHALSLICCAVLASGTSFAQEPGVAPGIPEPESRNVIVQLFNWKFNDVKDEIPKLKMLGYSHIHVSPPQKSNERVWQWWGRYQPINFRIIEGPLGSEDEFRQMADVAEANGIHIVVDVVLNHTIDINEMPPGFVTLQDDRVVAEMFPQFEPKHFHERCSIDGGDTVQKCWLSSLLDLKTEDSHVRAVAKEYLQKLVSLGADGFRLDAAVHIEPSFYPDVLSAVPDKFAFGEIIRAHRDEFGDHILIAELDLYDFPLVKTMREAFAFGGDLRSLKNPQASGQALEGPKAITFVRNHDIDRGQNGDRGIEDSAGRNTFGVGWDEARRRIDRTDVHLAYAYVLGREDGLPYVFADMNTLPAGQQDDRFDDPPIVAGIRFHNLSLANAGGVSRRPDIWRIETQDTVGWQRGDDRFVVINKAGSWYELTDLQTSLQPGEYRDIRTGWPMRVHPDMTIQHWSVPPRSAMMFVRVGG
jgi:alpha-amylase